MLGNFSFGDYFKREAIHWAWEFLTAKKWLGIDPARLSVTVYKDDDEARRIWREEIGLADSLIAGMEEDENFWPASAPSLGPDGVCGPCSEIYFHLDDGSDVEIWNLVFTQFNRVGDPPNNLRPLPSQNIDTGMGLERTASVLQGVPTNYHIDILMPIVQAVAEVTGVPYEYKSDNGRRLRRITDHVRACTFAVHENVYPGANGAKYVIRRLIRRAVLDGHQMSMREPFVYKLVGAVAEAMKSQYPELSETIPRVQDVIKSEEERFLGTIDVGLDRIDKLFGAMRSQGTSIVEGGRAAELYTSYGVPPELLQQMAAEHGFTFDWAGYKSEMEKHSLVSGGEQVQLFQTGPLETLKEAIRQTPFVGYEATQVQCVVKGIITGEGEGSDDGQLLSEVEGGTGVALRLVLDHTPFYGESGGQVGDTGVIRGEGFEFKVTDTQKHGGLVVHHGTLVSGLLKEGQSCVAEVDTARRNALCRAHSATHILHHALQKNVGSHAQQQGSKVDADWLRFDFSHQKSVPDETLAQIQHDILQRISANEPIKYETISLADARKAGAMMLFGEKYPDPVRMVSMGEFSRELCGGTHLTRTGDVAAFELLAEESVSAGTRRIIAVTGDKAQEYRDQTVAVVKRAVTVLGCDAKRLPERVAELVNDLRTIKKEISSGKAGEHAATFVVGKGEASAVDFATARGLLRDVARTLNVAPAEVADRLAMMLEERVKLLDELSRMTAGGEVTADDLMASAEVVGTAKLIVAATPGANPNVMRGWIDQLRKSSDVPVAVLLGAAQDDKVVLVGGLSHALVDKGLSAGNWVGDTAKVVGGGGGGRPDMAQAGGKDPAKLPAALEQAKASMREQLSR
jgi:alanyl-tRNA synthetase